MPRANRHSFGGQIWHITHRCHRREFLLRFRRDRRRWLFWAAAARRRYGLCVLNYIVTCNHIHLLVADQGNDEIARSMQLIAGRTAQEYNRRKTRLGAYWQDRYHATAVSTDGHLLACMTYIDLNMVRAGVVRHPAAWAECGYQAIQDPPLRYRIIDLERLAALLDCPDLTAVQRLLVERAEAALRAGRPVRQPHWSQSIAVGNRAFVESIQTALGRHEARGRILKREGAFVLQDEAPAYNAGSSLILRCNAAQSASAADNSRNN